MSEEKQEQDDGVNYTSDTKIFSLHYPKIWVHFSDHGIKVESKETGVIYFDMSYVEMADLISRLDSAEQEIGNLWAAIQGMKEAEE